MNERGAALLQQDPLYDSLYDAGSDVVAGEGRPVSIRPVSKASSRASSTATAPTPPAPAMLRRPGDEEGEGDGDGDGWSEGG